MWVCVSVGVWCECECGFVWRVCSSECVFVSVSE